MLGLFERIGEGLEMISLPISGAAAKARCEIANAIVDIKTDAKIRKYQKERLERMAVGDILDDDEEDVEEFKEEMLTAEQAKAYEKMFAEIVQHEEFCKRNPSEIGVELGYSEEEVKECFDYAQEKMESDMYNRFSVKKAFYGRSGFEKVLDVLTTKYEEEDKEQIIDVYCPKCGEKRTITPNTGFTCKGCGVRISVGAEGEISCLI